MRVNNIGALVAFKLPLCRSISLQQARNRKMNCPCVLVTLPTIHTSLLWLIDPCGSHFLISNLAKKQAESHARATLRRSEVHNTNILYQVRMNVLSIDTEWKTTTTHFCASIVSYSVYSYQINTQCCAFFKEGTRPFLCKLVQVLINRTQKRRINCPGQVKCT